MTLKNAPLAPIGVQRADTSDAQRCGGKFVRRRRARNLGRLNELSEG